MKRLLDTISVMFNFFLDFSVVYNLLMKLTYHPKNNNFCLKSIVSSKLTNNEIKQICLLKDKQWKFGIKSQLKWFKNNIKKFDLHNLFYIKSKLAGYTLLRKRTCKIENLKQN